MKSQAGVRVFSRRAIAAQAIPFTAGLALVGLFLARNEELRPQALLSGIGDVSAWQWLLALGFTLISYAAIGRYDRAIHGWIGTGVAAGAAENSGRTAIGISQMTGMGLVTGTFVRWYVLPDLSLPRAAAVTAAVGSTFLAGLVVVSSVLGLATGILPAGLVAPAWGALALTTALVAAVIALPGGSWRRHLPPLPRIATVCVLVTVDVVAAGAAFAALLGTADLQVLAAAVLSFGVGLVGATPAGIGGFEAALTGLLPGQDAALLMSAALAFHLIYFAVPAIAAVAAIFLAPGLYRRPAGETARIVPGRTPDVLTAADRATSAEAGLCAQPGTFSLITPDGQLLSCLRRGRSTLLGFAAPQGDAPLAFLADAARREGRAPLAYKIGQRDALRARNCGWRVRRCGSEAWLEPAAFSTDVPARRQLRRKLRQADKAGLSIAEATNDLPWADLETLDRAWQERRGPARGASMGRLDPFATARQRVFVARIGGAPMGFVTFHATAHEMTLDLMRADPQAPDGTMHALVAEAIAAAHRSGVPRLSLAAVPEHPLPAYLQSRLDAATGGPGLRQFKAAFAPNWAPLYAAAPSWTTLALGLIDMARDITAPDA